MAAPQPRFNPKKLRKNFHETYSQGIDGEWDLFMPQPGTGLTVADLKETTAQFQKLIGDAKQNGLKVRAGGSSWSLSKAPPTTGCTFNTNRLRGRLKLKPAD